MKNKNKRKEKKEKKNGEKFKTQHGKIHNQEL